MEGIFKYIAKMLSNQYLNSLFTIYKFLFWFTCFQNEQQRDTRGHVDYCHERSIILLQILEWIMKKLLIILEHG